MRDRLDKIKDRYNEINQMMMDPEVLADVKLLTKLSKEQKDYVSSISKSSDALLNVINDILDFSKIEAGQLELEEHDRRRQYGRRGRAESRARSCCARLRDGGHRLFPDHFPEHPEYERHHASRRTLYSRRLHRVHHHPERRPLQHSAGRHVPRASGRIGDDDVSDLPRRELAAQLAVVPQEPVFI